MNARMLDDIVAERVVVASRGSFGRLGRFEAHVVPAEILEIAAAHLAEALRAAWPGGPRPCGREGRRRERRKAWVRWPPCAPLLADDAAAEATDGTRTGRS